MAVQRPPQDSVADRGALLARLPETLAALQAAPGDLNPTAPQVSIQLQGAVAGRRMSTR